MDARDLIAKLRTRNESHDGPLGCAHWDLVRDAVDGTGGFLAGLRDLRVYDYGPGGTRGGNLGPWVADGSTYLAQFPRETREDFSARVRATTYDNHVAPVARTYLGQLFATPPTRVSSVDAVNAFWRDPDDGLGAVDAWMADGSARAQQCGWAACLLDRPEGAQPATAPGTVGRWLEPDELIDWEIDERGRFVWARLCSDRETRDPITGEETEAETITVWTRTWWRRFDIEERDGGPVLVGDTGEVANPLGCVPIAVLRWLPSTDADDLYAPSMLSGSVAAAVELFNVRSELRAIERDCVFPILCVQTDTPEKYEASKVSTHSGMTYGTGETAPAFIAPDASVTVHYAARIEELTTRCYEAAYLERPSAAAQAPESGVARAYRFRQMSALLVAAAAQHEAFEREVVSILAAWDGADAAAWQAATTISYPRRFDPQDADSAASAGLAILEKSDALVPEMVDQARRQIAAALFDRLSPDARRRLDAELAQRAAFERAAFEARFSTAAAAANAAAVATTSIDAATTAAVNALPAAAPGEVVSVNAAPMAGETTPPAGA